MNLGNTQAKILLVDDEVDVLDGLTTILIAAGYEVHSTGSPDGALQLLGEIQPDLIICDINLGTHNGLALCERIKRAIPSFSIPVMFLSGAQIPDVIRRAHAAGGTFYLRKPFDPQVLLELVDKALWMPHVANARLQRT